MTDRAERLRAAIAELERELRQLEESDPETRASLHGAASDLSLALQKPDAKPADTAASRNLIEQKVLEFEASHPEVSSALARFIDMLGQIGI
ncbi:DUF4404 family protein [Anatilimnocola floriformis]|uniref:DUF4404 family protein n=1 Tax=Anatilimnocola floriformis TaxID=2948575 RepID=UPI0020C4385E|nr:DUF4404 family protein [Anatilimnocola floriformis]